MKFVGHVLGDIDGIQNFYILGLLIFLSLFVVIVYRTLKIPKKDLLQFKTSIFEKDEMGSTNHTIQQ